MQKNNPQQQLVLWVIWGAMTMSVVIYQFFLGHGLPQGNNPAGTTLNPIVIVALVEILGASLVRWVLIPRAKAMQQVLVLMIVGLALSESVEFFGLFLIPSDQPGTKMTLWILSLLSSLQFAPFYARDLQPESEVA